ncbi:MAG: DNA-3-methyladenine glycosylase [Chlorobi bacterium]|nr:DNA-3-methyladenine glycosylase [Chlorobiota bacterium]
MNKKLTKDFYSKDAVTAAKELLGKVLVRRFKDGTEIRAVITETEAYHGEEDLGCHASKGRTPRTEVMYWRGGYVYVYLIYGMYWLLNIVTGPKNHPQAVLIRGTDLAPGPGRIGKLLKLDKSFYGEDLLTSDRIWIEEGERGNIKHKASPRIGIDYAGPVWSKKPWRFTTEP